MISKPATPFWRLDALDALGGLAFLSYRMAETQAGEIEASIPAVFARAPTFDPVNLTSRTIGLAASRRSFQAGLFIREEEIGFPELGDAIEFVRRCYAGGGGGAGAGPGGGLPPVPPEGEGPRPEFPGPPDFGIRRGASDGNVPGTSRLQGAS
jgi:hypothetical protein